MSVHTILVVEDSPAERDHLAHIFTANGYNVITAADGEEALRRTRDERPSLVLLDVVMPGLSGFQVARALSRSPETRDIPVVLLTGKSSETDRIWGMRQGARDYVIKPVTALELLARIERLLPAVAPATGAVVQQAKADAS